MAGRGQRISLAVVSLVNAKGCGVSGDRRALVFGAQARLKGTLLVHLCLDCEGAAQPIDFVGRTGAHYRASQACELCDLAVDDKPRFERRQVGFGVHGAALDRIGGSARGRGFKDARHVPLSLRADDPVGIA